MGTILIGQVGSRAYGTNVEGSDDDFMAIHIDELDSYLGMSNKSEQKELKRVDGYESDFVSYELTKFVRLCTGFNPNVIPLLWIRPEDYHFTDSVVLPLLENRDMFLSKELYHPFLGYAKSQLNKVHNGLTGKLGEKRKNLVAQYGYDVKFAYHTIRLLRMGIEALTTGNIHVYRLEDKDELIDIRSGKWELNKFLDCADKLIENAGIAYENSELPKYPNWTLINQTVQDMIMSYHNIIKGNKK